MMIQRINIGLCYTFLFRMTEEEQTMEWNGLYDAGRKPDMEQIGAFKEGEKEKYTCPDCGGVISVHDMECSECGHKASV